MGPPGTHAPGGVNAILTRGLASACCYAGTRPDCQALAVVRYGPVSLCASCDQQRSTLGKGTPATPLPDPHALLQIGAARQACQRAEAELREAVGRARKAGQPWSAIAATLGVTRQAAHQAAQQRFAGLD